MIVAEYIVSEYLFVAMCYHNRVSTTRFSFFDCLPHTASTSGTACVGVTIIVPLRGTARSARLLSRRAIAPPWRHPGYRNTLCWQHSTATAAKKRVYQNSDAPSFHNLL